MGGKGSDEGGGGGGPPGVLEEHLPDVLDFPTADRNWLAGSPDFPTTDRNWLAGSGRVISMDITLTVNVRPREAEV